MRDTHEPSRPTEWCYDLEDLPLREDELKRTQLVQQVVSALHEHNVRERVVARREIEELQAVIEHARGKKDMHKFIKEHIHVLARPLEGEYRWCIPQKALADSDNAPNFLLGQMGPLGLEWYGIELESPHTKPFIREGSPSATLSRALNRAAGWRTWLRNNIDYARRPIADGGLNLTDIGANIPYYIFIGRRKDLDDKKRERRRQLNRSMNVNICTYDWMMEVIGR